MSNRTNNVIWEKREKRIFLSLLRGYMPIIQKKTDDIYTAQSKLKAWSELQRKFNNLNRRSMDVSQLKKQWRRMRLHAQMNAPIKPNKENYDSELSDSSDDDDDLSAEEEREPSRVVQVPESTSNRTTSRLRDLKEREQIRRMEMAEEKHTIELNILKQKMRCALLERQLLEAQIK